MIVFDVKQQTKGSSIHVSPCTCGLSFLVCPTSVFYCVVLVEKRGGGVGLQAEGEQTGPRLRHSPTFIETIFILEAIGFSFLMHRFVESVVKCLTQQKIRQYL